MEALETVWKIKKVNHQEVGELAFDMRLPRPIAAIFWGRGLKDAEAVADFCSIGPKHLHSPFTLPDIDPVLARLNQAIDNNEHIYVHGDYDVDGVTATSVVCHTLKLLGANFEVHVPHRINDGYDVRPATVDKAIASGAKLMITVDCGIVAFEAATYAKEHGVDLIITDHHHPSDDGRVPDCIGVVNPNRHDSIYPFSGLAGVGIAFKVMAALAYRRGFSVKQMMNELLDYVALGTVADVAPMIDENRSLVAIGCMILNRHIKPRDHTEESNCPASAFVNSQRRTQKFGLQELLKIAGVTSVNTTSIGFFVGPRINAIGRLADADTALQLMLEQNASRASYMAKELDTANKKRQDLQEQVVAEAIAMLPEDLSETYVIVLSAKGWHPGLIGLVAGKVAEMTGRPTLVCTINEEGYAKGSCRSTRNFNILDALKSNGVHELFSKRADGSVVMGGHAFAAGFTLPAENIELFRERLNAYGKEMMQGERPARVLEADTYISAGDIDVNTYHHMTRMAPFGAENPEPLFCALRMVITKVEPVGAGGKHLKMRLSGSGRQEKTIAAIAWRRGYQKDILVDGAEVDVMFKLSMEEFRGRTDLTMTIEDIRISKS